MLFFAFFPYTGWSHVAQSFVALFLHEVLQGLRVEGSPSKHTASQGVVWRHVGIRQPPPCCFVPNRDLLQNEEDKALWDAWQVVAHELAEPFRTTKQWSHSDVTTWAKDDPKTPKRAKQAKFEFRHHVYDLIA